MKNLLLLLALISYLDAIGVEVEVSEMRGPSELEAQFDLITNYPDKVVLDCQSFIQGLFFGAQGSEQIVMLEEYECHQLILDMKQGLKDEGQHCFEVDFDRSILLQQGKCK